MKLRSLIIVIVVLAVLAAIAAFVRRPAPPPSSDPRVGQPVAGTAAIEKTAKLRLSDQGKTIEIVREDGVWRVPGYHDFAADFPKLSGLIGELGEARLQRLVTSNPERLSRLEFKDTRIELFDSANQPLLSLALGKRAETGGGRYVRFGDEQKAYLANLNASPDPEAKNWANTLLLDLKPEDISKVEITFPERDSVTLSRAKKDEPWTSAPMPERQQVKAERITTLLNIVGNIRFSDTASLDDPNIATANAHQRTVKLTTFDNKTVTIAMGRRPEEKKLKPPAPAVGWDDGPASLGSISDFAKTATNAKAGDAKSGNEAQSSEPKPLAPEFETIPAGPVFVSISHSDSAAPVNALMQKRAFQIYDYAFTGLPEKQEELFEPAPSPPPAVAEPKKE